MKEEAGKWVRYATPLFLVLILVEISDLIFAVDSIPAIFAITTDPFIVLTSNVFAILGLRAMYFLLADMADRFSLLKYGLGDRVDVHRRQDDPDRCLQDPRGGLADRGCRDHRHLGRAVAAQGCERARATRRGGARRARALKAWLPCKPLSRLWRRGANAPATGLETPLVQRSLIALILAQCRRPRAGNQCRTDGGLGHLADRRRPDHPRGVFVEIALRLAVHRLAFSRDPVERVRLCGRCHRAGSRSGPLAVLRALRVLRVLRLITLVPSMKRVVGGLLSALPGLGSVTRSSASSSTCRR